MGTSFTGGLAVLLIRLLARTWRVRHAGSFPPDDNAIIAFWHGKMLPVWKAFAGKNSRALVSLSKDGEILAALLESWKYQVSRGSTSRGGKEALDSIISGARGSVTLITPDGPRGPAREFKAGAAVAASRSGVPVVLCGVKIRHFKTFGRSWDRFRLPLPFTRVDLTFSAPYPAPGPEDRDAISEFIKLLESELNKIDPE